MDLSGDTLRISRTLSALDEDVITFVEHLDDIGVNYVIVSGYVAILTGRLGGRKTSTSCSNLSASRRRKPWSIDWTTKGTGE